MCADVREVCTRWAGGSLCLCAHKLLFVSRQIDNHNEELELKRMRGGEEGRERKAAEPFITKGD